MDDRISPSLLSMAADCLADTNNGLSGSTIIRLCNAYAVEHDITIPHSSYPFQTSKRAALFENLRAFPFNIQYKIVTELCEHPQFAENDAVKKIGEQFRNKHSHLNNSAPAWALPSPPVNSPITARLPPPPLRAPTVVTPAPIPEIRPFEVFLSYSHEDEDLMNFVRKHLVVYERQGKILKKWDRKIAAGTPLDPAISEALTHSDVVLLFVSASFLASDYCYEVEMKNALAQHEQGRSIVIPIILRDCVWRDTDLGKLLALPTDGRALTAWSDKDAAGRIIAEGVMRATAEFQKRKTLHLGF